MTKIQRVVAAAVPAIKGGVTMGLLTAMLSVLGCDAQKIADLEEGVSTEADVRARFGEPEKIWLASDMLAVPMAGAAAERGAQTFEYSRQPQGAANYLITLGPDGRMTALRQVLNPQTFALVRPGLPMETVRKMLGRPMKVTPYALAKTTHHDWRYIDPPNTSMVFTAVFDSDLRVISAGSVREDAINPSAAY